MDKEYLESIKNFNQKIINQILLSTELPEHITSNTLKMLNDATQMVMLIDEKLSYLNRPSKPKGLGPSSGK